VPHSHVNICIILYIEDLLIKRGYDEKLVKRKVLDARGQKREYKLNTFVLEGLNDREVTTIHKINGIGINFVFRIILILLEDPWLLAHTVEVEYYLP